MRFLTWGIPVRTPFWIRVADDVPVPQREQMMGDKWIAIGDSG